MKNVLVTGANGHVGHNLVRLLIEKGYRVRASVRDASQSEKTARVRALGAEVVEAELLKPESLKPALDGMDGLFQVAAVYQTYARNPDKEIIEPIVVGSMNILKAAKAAGIKKVIFTSSIVAMGSDATEERPLTEGDWNQEPKSPYFLAKTRAERNAWAYAKESGLRMVVINPGAIIGPGFYRHTPSTFSFELLLRGKLPMVLPTGFTFVDVRDVAQAHVLAYESEKAQGRYLAVDEFHTMKRLMGVAKKLFPDLKVPRQAVPASMLGGVAFMDWMAHALWKVPRQVTLAMVSELGGKYQRASGEKIRRELGWKPMAFEDSLRDTLNWIRMNFL